jgi:hypothetical protein
LQASELFRTALGLYLSAKIIQTKKGFELQGAALESQEAALVIVISLRADFEARAEIDQQEHRVCFIGHHGTTTAPSGSAAALGTQLEHTHATHGFGDS